MQDGEGALTQENVGGIFRDVNRIGHRNPDLGGMERRGIIDAIA